MSLDQFQAYGRALEQLLRLGTVPVAVKMLKSEDEIPADAIRPKRDRGYHLAQCQAFAMARRQNLTVAMLKEDHWCFAPLIGYGLVDMPDDEFVRATTSFPCFPRDKYIGMLSGPLSTTTFEPDMVLIYGEPGQVRRILMAVKFGAHEWVSNDFDPIDSCIYDVVPVIEKGEYRITIPDPGEVARAATRDNKIIFSIPGEKVAVIVQHLQAFTESKEMNVFDSIEMRPDFPRPGFYTRLFEKWGLDTESSSPGNK